MGKHYVIIVPGIPSFALFFKIFTYWLHFIGFTPIIVDIHWTDSSTTFTQKQQQILTLIDTYSEKNIVSLIGISAGGSAVLNAFFQRKDKIHAVVTVCSRIRKFHGVVTENMKKYPAVRQSVELFEKNETLLSLHDRQKILTIRGLFDERMPSSVIPIDGATNRQYPLLFHAPIIFLSLSIFSKPLLSFLQKK